MCDLLRDSWQFLGSMDWPAIAQVGIGIWMAIIATSALSTWKRQTKAQKRTDFIDEMADTVHAFVVSMHAPVHCLMLAKLKIDCYTGIHGESPDIKNPEAVAFIKKDGKSYQQEIGKYLNEARPFLIKMKSLVTKGQIFGIEDYSRCQKACSMFEWSYNQIETFSSIIGNPDWYWNNPDVQQAIDNVLSIDSESIKNNLAEQGCEFFLFAKQAYDKTLK